MKDFNSIPKPQLNPAENGQARSASAIKKGYQGRFRNNFPSFTGIFLYSLLLGLLCLGNAIGLIAEPVHENGGGVTIVMEDDILIVDSGDPDDVVDRIIVSQDETTVLTQNNCGGQVCTTSLASLSSGIYLVEVYTQNEEYSSQEITVN